MKVLAALAIGSLGLLSARTASGAPCVGPSGSVPGAANTTQPDRPFYIDTQGFDLRATPPLRDPDSKAYPQATHLADGALPPATEGGNFVLAPDHMPAPETDDATAAPHGRVVSFVVNSQDSHLFNPGIMREDPANCSDGALFAAPTMAGDPSALMLNATRRGPWSRQVEVYVPAQYVQGTAAPLLVFGDGGRDGFYDGRMLFAVLDNLIATGQLPPIVAVGVGAGGQDAQGSERGREYDTVSGTYAAFVEREILPRAEAIAHVRLTHDPEGRVAMGVSSSGAAAFAMAWFRPDLYHRVLAYSPTFTNQQWPQDPDLPGGAWQFHDAWAGPAGGPRGAARVLIRDEARKPIRFWFEAGDQDLFYPAANMPDGMHDWVLANERMAQVLQQRGYSYQFVLSQNASHVDRPTIEQTLPEALLWVWQGYRPVPVRGGGR